MTLALEPSGSASSAAADLAPLAYDEPTVLASDTGSGASLGPLRGAYATRAPAEIPTINGRPPINSRFAGETFSGETWTPGLQAKYPNGVQFSEQGFPNFSPYARQTATSEQLLTGNVSRDMQTLGLKNGAGYRWHHVEDGLTMQQVPTDIHEAVRHTGGAAVSRQGANNLFCFLARGC